MRSNDKPEARFSATVKRAPTEIESINLNAELCLRRLQSRAYLTTLTLMA